MTPADATASAVSAVARRGVSVTFRRVTGVAPSTTKVEATVAAVVLDYQPDTTDVRETGYSDSQRGAITQGMRQIIVQAAALSGAGFPLPVRKNDKAIVTGIDGVLNIDRVDAAKRAFSGTIELMASGVA